MTTALKSAICRVTFWLPSVISLFIAVGAYYVFPDSFFQSLGKILLPFSVILVFLCVVLFTALRMGTLPKISRIVSTVNIIPRDYDFIVLIEPYAELSHDALCCLFHTDQHNFEICVALGYVLNIQADKRIQVLMRFTDGVLENVKNGILSNEDTIKKHLILKPQGHRMYMEVLR